jgi:Domain of unknown function (DUF4440)
MKILAGLWLALYLSLASCAFAQTPDARQEVERLEEQARQAALKGDTGFVEKYAAADYLGIMANGLTHGKAEEIESRRMGKVTYQTIDVHESKIRLYGNTAVCNSLAAVTFTAEERGYKTSFYNQHNGEYRFTRVWVKQDGDWKLVSFQSTKAGQ